jgi:hypothetical protein
MAAELETLKRFLSTTDILNNLYPGYVSLVPAPGANRVIVPHGPCLFVYGFGTVAYGGDPNLQLGVPGDGIAVWRTGFSPGVTATQSQIVSISPILGLSNLSLMVNQPLVVSADNSNATLGPLKTSALAAAGTGYAVNDTGVIDPSATVSGGDATYKVLTRNASTGAVLTYQVTNPGTAWDPALLPATVATDSSGSGTGFTVRATAVTQGNGQLYIEFDYSIVTVPYPVR